MAVSHIDTASFEMVHIPVGLYTAMQVNDTCFAKKMAAIYKYKKVCSSCGKEIGNNDIVKGFEYEPNKYVTMTESEHWVKPLLVCKVECMEKITSGSMRQPVFKGLRDD